MKMKKRKIVLYGLAALVALGLFAMLSLKTWASYRLKQVNWQQPRASALAEGKNLLDTPLWLDFLKESFIQIETQGDEEVITADWPERTNALSRWKDEQTAKYFQYDQFKPEVGKKVKPRPGNLDSTERELLPTFEALQKGPEKEFNDPVPPELSSIIGKYEAREDLSDEGKVLAVFLEYFQSGDPATEEEVKKSLAESSYFGITGEIYTKLGLSEEDVLFYPMSSLVPLKVFAQHYGYTARWNAYSGQREKTLEELQPLLNLASLEGHNSTLIESLVRYAIRSISANVVHAIIRENVLNEEDLLSIQTRFSRMNMMEDLRQTLEGEEAYCGKMFRVYRVESDLLFMGDFWQRSFIKLVCSFGYMDLNKAAVFKAMRSFRAAIDTEGQTLDYAAWKKAEDLPKSLFNILARETISSVGNASNRFLRVQSERDAVILGCALERYRLKEGSFPEKLEALIPEYLPQMPPGSLSQGSLSYTRTEKGYELTLNKLPELPEEDRMETIWRR